MFVISSGSTILKKTSGVGRISGSLIPHLLTGGQKIDRVSVAHIQFCDIHANSSVLIGWKKLFISR